MFGKHLKLNAFHLTRSWLVMKHCDTTQRKSFFLPRPTGLWKRTLFRANRARKGRKLITTIFGRTACWHDNYNFWPHSLLTCRLVNLPLKWELPFGPHHYLLTDMVNSLWKWAAVSPACWQRSVAGEIAVENENCPLGHTTALFFLLNAKVHFRDNL